MLVTLSQGEMLLSAWETEATALANANGEAAAQILSGLAQRYQADPALTPTVR